MCGQPPQQAQELYAALPAEGRYCLTTLLCAADRRRQLAEIRQRLRMGCPAGSFPPP